MRKRPSVNMRSNIIATLFLAVFIALTGCKSQSCDQLRIIKDYYDSTDELDFNKSVSYFSEDAELIIWAEGVNGRHWQEKHYHGADQIRNVLNNRGLRRITDVPNSPRFFETEVKLKKNGISFMLRPDRLSADERAYNPYGIDVLFENCKIKKMTVIEYISWE